MSKLLKDAVDVFGTESTIYAAIGEMGELTTVLMDRKRPEKGVTLEGILKEIADVKMCIEKLVIALDPDLSIFPSCELSSVKKLKGYIDAELNKASEEPQGFGRMLDCDFFTGKGDNLC